jgi:type IV pilus assembly protein PilW
MNRISSSNLNRPRQSGFTIIELMIALLISLFLLGGLLTIVQSNRRVFGNQNQLSQLQDSERLALTMMTDVAQTAGYFPDPTSNSAQSTMLVLAAAAGLHPAMASGQAMSGLYNAAAPGDSLTVRYVTGGSDGILGCTGVSSATPMHTFVNTFSVVVDAAGDSQLVCTREDGVQYPLVNGVTQLTVMYGVNTTGSGSNVDSYQNATQVTGGSNWSHVISMQITLRFTNPLSAEPGQPAYFDLKRNIAVMNQTGI